MENVHLTASDWKFLWEQNLIPFHRSEVDPYLLSYECMLLEENNKVFVPLCGKTMDLVYLAEKGHDVFGCEFTTKAVLDFFFEVVWNILVNLNSRTRVVLMNTKPSSNK